MTLRELETYARFVITAHRGDLNPVDGWPEGTLEGYRQAVRKGCGRVDLDVRLSADGTFYVMHDSTVTRTTNGSGALEGKTDAQIDALVIDGGLGYKASLHAGLNLRVPKLLSVVQALDDYRIIFQFDQKDTGDTTVSTALAQFMVANGLTHTAFVSNGDVAALQAVDPDINATYAGPGDWVPAEDYGAVDEAALTRQAWADGLFSFTVNDVDAALAVRKNLLSTSVRVFRDGAAVGYASEIDVVGAESVSISGLKATISLGNDSEGDGDMPSPAVGIGAQKYGFGAESYTNARADVVSSHANANEKGTWVELENALPFAIEGFYLQAECNDSAARSFLVDVGIGAAASEQVVLSNLQLNKPSTGTGTRIVYVFVPLHLPAGVRVAARCQDAAGGNAIRFALAAYFTSGPLGFKGLSHTVTYGANTGDSGGVSVDPGATINTKGSYSEITSATTAPIRWVILSLGNQANNERAVANWGIHLAVGGAGSEQDVFFAFAASSTTGDDIEPYWLSFPLDIPTGSRIAAAAQCTINDATDRLLDVSLIGLS